MELVNEIVIDAPLDVVYAGLNDPAILKQCIPGCETLDTRSDTEMDATVVLKVGPVKARFAGSVTLDREGAPFRFRLTGTGNGGIAGFAKGGASVTLEPADGGTRLSYQAKADVSGKIAQLGSRLILATADKLSRQFFSSFVALMEGEKQDAQ